MRSLTGTPKNTKKTIYGKFPCIFLPNSFRIYHRLPILKLLIFLFSSLLPSLYSALCLSLFVTFSLCLCVFFPFGLFIFVSVFLDVLPFISIALSFSRFFMDSLSLFTCKLRLHFQGLKALAICVWSHGSYIRWSLSSCGRTTKKELF